MAVREGDGKEKGRNAWEKKLHRKEEKYFSKEVYDAFRFLHFNDDFNLLVVLRVRRLKRLKKVCALSPPIPDFHSTSRISSPKLVNESSFAQYVRSFRGFG